MTLDRSGYKLFGETQVAREQFLLPRLNQLTEHHYQNCLEYGRMIDAFSPDWALARSIEELPFLPVGMFKDRRLSSVPSEEIFKTVTSSGTTGQRVSQVVLDRNTSKLQSNALLEILGDILGKNRLPMLIIDAEETIKSRDSRNARAAGIIGLMSLGRKFTFSNDNDMNPSKNQLIDFLTEHGEKPFLVFGFTFMVWQYLYQPYKDLGLDMSNAILVHSGGWKNLVDQSVDNSVFRKSLYDSLGIKKIVNFYGMAEQTGSIFIESDDMFLHPSIYSDVIIRDPLTLKPLPVGKPGIVQVLSVLPHSYPGHSILTEDIGIIESIDDKENKLGGKSIRIIGRLPKSELRGCSDVHANSRA
jgi:hypothetical protein